MGRPVGLKIAIVAFDGVCAGDSAIGMEVASKMDDGNLPENIVVIKARADAYKVLENLRRFDGLVIVNAATMGEDPGAVRVFDLNDLILKEQMASITFHGLKRNADLVLAHKFLDLPPARIVCIQPNSLNGEEISQALQAKIDDYILAVKHVVAQFYD